jgi:hypothetical protein
MTTVEAQGRIDAIVTEQVALRERLRTVQGTETEVYTRIVGYYRNKDHWNPGKKGEYRDRVPFKLPGERK